MRRIRITIDGQEFYAALDPGPVADAVLEALPLEVSGSTWGDEIYCDIGVQQEPEETRETVEAGDVAYWPPGRALCLFYGPTPMSAPGEIRPASPVAVFGSLEGDPAALKPLRGREIRVEPAT